MGMDFHKPGTIDRDLVRPLLPPRCEKGGKWEHGAALLVAGSAGMCGAASFAARAAYRVGCGYLRLAAPAGALQPLQLLAPSAVLVPLGSSDCAHLTPDALLPLVALCNRANCWAVGPGLSTNPLTVELLRALFPRLSGTGVIDADGLNALQGDLSLLQQCRAQLILTPHAREWERLFGEPLSAENATRSRQLRLRAVELGQTIVAKGATTLVALPTGELWEYRGNCSALAKAGSGDSLTGALLGLLAQGASTADAARLAVWLHGEAGQIAAKKWSPYGLLPEELPDFLPLALHQLLATE